MGIDALYFPRSDGIDPISNNAVKVILYEPGEPEKVLVPCTPAPVNDVNKLFDHRRLVFRSICLLYRLLDEIAGEQELV